MPVPGCDGLSLNPYPGIVGHTTWKASAASPPWLAGSRSGSMASKNSTTDPGHPCVNTTRDGIRLGRRRVSTWIPSGSPPAPVPPKRSCWYPLSSASTRRQS